MKTMTTTINAAAEKRVELRFVIARQERMRKPIMNIALWIVQVLLALLFLFSGGTKFVLSPDQLKAPGVELPILFLRFIGVCEVLGGLGLVLPGLLKIRTGLTPLAAAGLVIIMIGATVISFMAGGIGAALVPLVTGILAVFVAYGRWKMAPLQGR